MNKKLTDKEILLAVMGRLGLTVKQFSDKLGYKTVASIYNAMNVDGYKLSTQMIAKITSAFPHVNPVFLMTGEGGILNTDEKQAVNNIDAASSGNPFEALAMMPAMIKEISDRQIRLAVDMKAEIRSLKDEIKKLTKNQ